MSTVDHLVYATTDLDATVESFTAATGIRPEVGGSHTGLGTRNELVSLGDCYLELIGPDPAQPEPGGPRPFGIDSLARPGLVAFAVRPGRDETIEQLVDRSKSAGFDPGGIIAMSRTRPDGDELSWRLTLPPSHSMPSTPFLIDWGDTPLPASTVAATVELVDLSITDPRADQLRELYTALELRVSVIDGHSAGIAVTLRVPWGSFS